MASTNNPVTQINGNTAQYAVKKRRRPQAKKDKTADKELVKSNPSKRHRDRLNNELDELSQLIPFSPDVLNKLDKLSILRLVVSYLRNKNYHAAEGSSALENDLGLHLAINSRNQVASLQESESKLALEALHGFLIVVNQDYNIFYVTETVQDYLGYPQSDMMNLSMLDFVHVDDRETFMKQLRINKNQPVEPPQLDNEQASSMPEYAKLRWTPEWFQGLSRDGLMHRSFICRLRCLPDTSSGFLALHFTGHLRLIPGQNRTNEQKVTLPPEVGLFLLASPLQSPSILEIRTKNFIFRTKHKLDYTPLGIDAKGKVVLGYTEQQLRQRSGYEFIHSADMMHCADAHTKLMRLGESGCTVFRLLHKDNRWIWVTASARLIYRNGQPDCIIATQKPIQDQEGEEELKKRSTAFRFDFTGQAILYGEVNPIGTQGGPENNPLDEEPPMSKKQRMYNANEVDRMSLYGAQAMQRMDIYMGNLPNQPKETFGSRPVLASAGTVQSLIKDEQISDLAGPLEKDSRTTFYPLGTDLTQQQQEQAIRKNMFRNPNNYPLEANSFQQAYNTSGQLCSSGGNNMNSSNFSSSIDEAPALYHPPENELNLYTGANMPQHNSLKRPYPGSSDQNSYIAAPGQCQMIPSGRQMSIGESTTSNFLPHSLQQQQQQQQQQQPIQQVQNCHPGRFDDYGQRAPVNPMISNQHISDDRHFAETANTQFFQTPNQAYQQELNNLNQPIKYLSNQQSKQTPSVLDSLTIDSVVHTSQQVQPNNSTLPQQNVNPNIQIPDQYNTPQCIGFQDNTIRFDLQKIAADYQTTDPLAALQDYMHDNPSHAAAIATGMHPTGSMVKKLSIDKAGNFMPSCQFQSPQSQHSINQVNSQMKGYPNSISSDSSSGIFSQNLTSSEDGFSNVGLSPHMSVSSIDSQLDLAANQSYSGYQHT